MGRFRARAFIGAVATGGLIALAVANCAAPTQIIIDVRADRSLCSGPKAIQGTGIVVTSPDRVDEDPLEIFEGAGCDDPPGDQIGTLTISPSGANDAEVGIRIVSGVSKPAKSCRPPWEGCIVARRRVRFTPGKTVPVTVIMSEECIGKGCGALECDPNSGACVPPDQILPDGGIDKDAGPLPDARVPDAAPDAPTEGVDACVNCNGTSCSGRLCTVDCNQIDCTDKTVCGAGLDCNVICTALNKCTRTRCANPTGACTFNCTGGTGNQETHCSDISCSAMSCNVACKDSENTCNGVDVDGGTNVVDCLPTNNATTTCNKVNCGGGNCKRTCHDGGCGPQANCSGNCAMWEDAGDGGS